MKQQDFFGKAKWVGAAKREPKTFSVLRGHFCLKDMSEVALNILGMGFFKCYINGQCINSDTFLPLSSEYDGTTAPEGEEFTEHRVYVPQFDITPYVKKGDNTIAVHFGGGWYIYEYEHRFPQAIYQISAKSASGVEYFVSDENCRIGKSYVCGYDFTRNEMHDYSEFEDCFGEDFDDSAWENAVETEGIDTEYCTTDCPADKLIEKLAVTKAGNSKNGVVYDCGRNTSGYPVLKINAKRGEKVSVVFAEEITEDGELGSIYIHDQRFEVVSDGNGRTLQPEFIWYGFRYMEVVGDAEVECVKEIYADTPINSSFSCDSETINWIYETFMHTMHTNMHTGHPSDCPHIERRGYTGDGQVTCHAALSVLDARKFYEKWLQDIADTQDIHSGHIQYTAPYVRSGGGPGGWGSAIVEVPYQMYRHYGDKSILEAYYGNMRRYIDYLETHSEFGLVTSDRKGEWCLGDWCGPNILYSDRDITYFEQQVFLPAPYVNTYFMVRSLTNMAKIAKIIGKDCDAAEYEEKIRLRKAAIQAAYFNTFDGNFVMNVQGANCYAVDLGLGDESTYTNMVNYYKKLGCFDTGIFATDILIRTLLERGDEELAVELLMSEGEQGFAHWRKGGATTFHEYWDSNRSRSHNHHMFGAVTAYLFEYILGIKQKADTAGYTSLVIEPVMVSKLNRASGSMTVPAGVVAVSYEKKAGRVKFEITIPKGVEAVLSVFGSEKKLNVGENVIEINE